MKAVLGIVLIALGVAVGLYVGVWWGFIGGIVQVVTAIRADKLVESDIAIGIAKILFAQLFGWVSAAVLVFPGAALLKD